MEAEFFSPKPENLGVSAKPDLAAEREYLRKLIFKRAITVTDDFVYDFREMLTDAHIAEIAGRLMWENIKSFQPEVLVGPGYGATPLLYSTALAALRDGVNLKVLMVRERRKEHHRQRWVEGARPKPGSRAIVIDDFMKAGSAVRKVDEGLAADKIELKLLAFGVFFDMWQPLGSRQIAIARYPVLPIFRRHDIGETRDCYDAKPPEMKGSHPPFLGRQLWWRFDVHRDSEFYFRSAPVIADGGCFVADNQCRVWRHDLKTGRIDWKVDSISQPMKGIVNLLQYHDKSLVYGCYDGTVSRLNSEDGRIIWRLRQGTHVHATPEVDLANRRLFINTEQWNDGNPYGHLLAMDWDTGRTIWRHDHAYWPPGTPAYSAQDGVVVATCNDQSLICVEADTGKLRWSVKTKGLVRGQAAVADGNAYVATESGWLHSVCLEDGHENWRRQYRSGLSHSFLRVIDGNICALDARGMAFFFDQKTGELEWLSTQRNTPLWRPVNAGRYELILTTGGDLAVLDPKRRLKVREDSFWTAYGQPPGVGEGHIALVSNYMGMKVFEINPFYLP